MKIVYQKAIFYNDVLREIYEDFAWFNDYFFILNDYLVIT